MKVTVTINDTPVEIELTKTQVDLIKKKTEKITDRVKSFEDACSVLGVSVSDILGKNNTKDEIAYKKLKTIIKALNEGWVPDWSNTSEYKWFPYFDYESGFGFSGSNSYCWDAGTRVSSRLVLKSEELSKYAATQFKDIYNDYLDI